MHLTGIHKACLTRNCKELLQKKQFKVTFFLVSLCFSAYIVSTSTRLIDEFGFDYTIYRGRRFTLVTEPRIFAAAQFDCKTRFSGRLIVFRETAIRVHLSAFLRGLPQRK